MEDEVINKIPFENLRRKEADQREYSPYAKMAIALRGYLVFEKKTCEKIDRYELYHRHYKDTHSLRMIINKTHPRYKFITRQQWESINTNTNRTTDHSGDTY